MADTIESTKQPGVHGLVALNPDGSNLGQGFSIGEYDYVSVAYPTTTTEVYTFKTGGSSGTTIATITLTYTDSTKEYLSSAEKS